MISGCSREKETTTDKDTKKELSDIEKKGKEIFYTASQSNNLRCADCHSDGTNDSIPLTSFFPDVKGANKRISVYGGKFKGEDVVKNAAGATLCWDKFLEMESPMSEEEIKSLNAYYNFLATGSEPGELKFESIALPEPDRTKLKEEQAKVLLFQGDSGKGENIFNESCKFCHNEKTKIKNVPDLFQDFEGNAKSVTFMVRFGKEFMPFYSNGKLTTQDIADLAAYILSRNK